MTITAIVFDVGNVLVSWDLEFLYRSVIEDPDARREFLAEVLTAEMNRQIDAGRSVDEALAELVDAHPDKADWILAFRHRWIETMGPQIDGSVELFDQLQATGLPIFALTNFGAETWLVAHVAWRCLSKTARFTRSIEATVLAINSSSSAALTSTESLYGRYCMAIHASIRQWGHVRHQSCPTSAVPAAVASSIGRRNSCSCGAARDACHPRGLRYGARPVAAVAEQHVRRPPRSKRRPNN